MANRDVSNIKSLSLKTWLTRLAWVWLGISLIFVILFNWLPTENLLLALSCLAWLTLTPPIALAWLVFVHRYHFRSWRTLSILAFLLSVSTYVWQILTNSNSGLLSLLAMLLFWYVFTTLPVVMIIFLWYRDAGLPLLAILSVAFVWAAVISVTVQGSLIDSFVETLNMPTEPSPLWWFYPLWSFIQCGLVIGIASFIGHTIRLLILEFTTGRKVAETETAAESIPEY